MNAGRVVKSVLISTKKEVVFWVIGGKIVPPYEIKWRA